MLLFDRTHTMKRSTFFNVSHGAGHYARTFANMCSFTHELYSSEASEKGSVLLTLESIKLLYYRPTSATSSFDTIVRNLHDIFYFFLHFVEISKVTKTDHFKNNWAGFFPIWSQTRVNTIAGVCSRRRFAPSLVALYMPEIFTAALTWCHNCADGSKN